MKIIIVPDEGEWVLVPKVATDETHGRKMNMREAFEAWIDTQGGDTSRHKFGYYNSEDVERQWEAWQSGATFAARRCAGIAFAKSADSTDEAIRKEFQEAFRE